MLRNYNIIHPSSEQELGEILRARALGEGVLDLIARNEPDFDRNFRLYIRAIHLADGSHSAHNEASTQLPFLLGRVKEVFGEQELNVGFGRLEVTGSQQDDESKRPLSLTVAEADDPTLDKRD